jgi:hypothetical protein
MKESSDTWSEVRRMADELNVQMHLATMEVRDAWHALQPRIEEVGREIARSSAHVDAILAQKVAKLGTALRKLKDDLGKS